MNVDKISQPLQGEQREFVLEKQPVAHSTLYKWAHIAAEHIKIAGKFSRSISKFLLPPAWVIGMFLVTTTRTDDPPLINRTNANFELEIIVYGIGLAAAIALQDKMFLGMAKGIETLVEKSNNAKLRDDIVATSQAAGIVPHKFIDPVTQDTIEDPVAFMDDPSGTIFDRKTATELLERKMNHPLVPSLALKIENLVSLPEVKKQIEELKKAEQLKNKIEH